MNASFSILPHKHTSNCTKCHFTVHCTSNPSYTCKYVRDINIFVIMSSIERVNTTVQQSARPDTGLQWRRAGWKIRGGTHACWRMPKEPGRCDRTPEKRDDYTAWHLKTVSLQHPLCLWRKIAPLALNIETSFVLLHFDLGCLRFKGWMSSNVSPVPKRWL